MQRSIEPGDVIARGARSLTGDDSREFPEAVTIGVDGDVTAPDVTLTVRTTSDYRMVVEGIQKFRTLSLDTQPQDVVSRWQGGAWSRQHDVAGITLTEVYGDMYYYDERSASSSVVYADTATGAYNYCYSARDGWHKNWCSADRSPNGPDYVAVWTEGNFSYIGGSYTHTHSSYFYGFPGGDYRIGCNNSGALVPQGYWECHGNLRPA